MRQISRKRRFGAVTALVAAYALVLNVILSSALLAALSPAAYAANAELCVSSLDAGAAHDDGNTTGKAVIHCPVCVGNHAAGSPPPPGPSFIERIAIAATPAFVFDTPFVALSSTRDHQARAPPQLT